MKILCIADIHGDRDMAFEARNYAVENDIEHVLILGDFPGHGVFHNIGLSTEITREILELFKAMKVIAIPGNCDPQSILQLLDKYGVNLHEKVVSLGGASIAGFGGSNITPFETPFEYPEDEIYSRLKKLMSSVRGENTILALHCPPQNTKCDKTTRNLHAGSNAIRRIIEEHAPALAVCSHIHEAGGTMDTIGKTKVANIGRLTNGNIGIIDLGDRITVELTNIKKT